MTISRSKRPGRRSASSIASGRLVAAMTMRFWRGSSPSSRVSNCATSRFSVSPVTWPRLGAIESISSMKMIDGALAAGLLEQVAQALLALAISRAHDLRPGDMEEIGLAFIGDGAREARLAGAGRAVQQHALGRIDAEPLENLGIAQRQLDHLAELIDGRADAADIVISDVGAAGLLGLGIFGAKLDLGIGVDQDDALGRGRDDDEADLLQREGGRGQHLAKLGRDVAPRHLLLAGGGDDVAGGERLHPEAALQRLGGAVQAQILLRRREDDARCAGLASALRTSTRSPEPSSALARCRPSRRMMLRSSSSG